MTPNTFTRAYRKINGRWIEAAETVPCGKCPECLHRRSEAWAFRLYTEKKNSSSSKFLTFTYDENHVPYVLDKDTGELTKTLDKKDFQKFMKKFRKINPVEIWTNENGETKSRSLLKYYTCGEYGTETARPHYHSIMFNMDCGGDLQKRIEDNWQKGNVDVKPVNLARIRYVTKYITKRSYYKPALDDVRNPEFAVQSKGLGLSYITPAMREYHKKGMVGVVTGKGGLIQPLPKYFKEKIFTKQERYKIAEECQALAEEKNAKKFKNPEHELIWKHDQYRKVRKVEHLKRSQL